MSTTVEIEEIRNATSLNSYNTSFYLEIKHPHHDWIPYTLCPEDTDNHVNNDKLLELIGTNFTPYVAPTEEEVRKSMESNIRFLRDQKLQELDTITMNPIRWKKLSDEKKAELEKYHQGLTDIPDQNGFPNDVVWPQFPAGIWNELQ